MRMQITFRSGAQVTVGVSKFKTGRSPVTGRLASLDWSTPGDTDTWLHGLYDLDEVVAIVGIDDPEPAPAEESA